MGIKYPNPRSKILFNYVECEWTGCWEWQLSKNHKGYGFTYHRGRTWKAHRLSWHLFRGDIPVGVCVLHHCDNPGCCNPEHLFLGTNSDNVRDMVSKGRQRGARGENNGRAKLSDAEVVEIRRMYSTGNFTQQMIATRLGVSRSHVGRIIGMEYRTDPGLVLEGVG